MKIKTIVQAIHYILSNIGQADKKKIIKMLFLADKHHLLTMGRTITDDKYIAMKHGPFGSMALDILDLNMEYLDMEQIAFAKKYLENIGYLNYKIKTDSDYEMLSKSDKKSLDFIISKFGHLDSNDIEEITHKFPEWHQHEEDLVTEKKRSFSIKNVELFSVVKDIQDPLNIPVEKINLAKEIYCGYC